MAHHVIDACHVIDSRRLIDVATSSTRFLNRRFFSEMATYDVTGAANVARHAILRI